MRRTARQAIGVSIQILLLACCVVPLCGGADNAGSANAQGSQSKNMELKEVLGMLTGDDTSLQVWATNNIPSFGKLAVPSLLDQMENGKNGDAKIRAKNALVKIFSESKNRTPEALIRLERFAASGKYFNASNAVECISQFANDAHAEEILARIALTHTNSAVRAVTLGDYFVFVGRGEKSRRVLERGFNDESLDVRLTAARLLGELGDSRGAKLVLSVLESDDVSHEALVAQRDAINAAARIGSKKFIPLLKKILADPRREEVSSEANVAIAEIELGDLPAGAGRIHYLEEALAKDGLGYWAGMQLSRHGTPEALAVLKRISIEKNNPGWMEAYRWYWISVRNKSSDGTVPPQ